MQKRTNMVQKNQGKITISFKINKLNNGIFCAY